MGKIDFQPVYNNLVDVLYNRKPKRLPLYEHNIDLPFIQKCLGEEIPFGNTQADLEKFPFDDIPRVFWEKYTPHLEAIRKVTNHSPCFVRWDTQICNLSDLNIFDY